MARTNLDGLFFMDSRFEYLGDLTGKGEFDARGRIQRLWQICIDRLEDVMSSKEIGIQTKVGVLAGREFADHMVEALLAEKVGDDLYRIRGVRKRSEWLENAREAGKKGGRPSTRSASSKKPSENRKPPQNPPVKTENPPETTPSDSETHPFENERVGNLIVMDMGMDTDTNTDLDIVISENQKTNPEAYVEVLISDAINARHDCLEESEAKEKIDPLGWALLMRQYSTWQRFSEAYARHYPDFEPKFRKDLKLALLGRIEQKPRGRGSGIQVVNGGARQ